MSDQHHTPAASLREEPTIMELIEARERADGGLRLAVPMLFDGLGADPAPVVTVNPPEVDHDTAKLVGGELLDARLAVEGAGKGLPLEGHVDLHLRFNALINEIDRIGAILAERRAS